MIKTDIIIVLLVSVASVLGAIANWLFKKASPVFLEIPLWRNYYLILGVVSFLFVLALFIIAFRMGGKMMIVYPVYATTYVWALLIAYKIEKETLTLLQLVGVIAIILGVVLIGSGSKT